MLLGYSDKFIITLYSRLIRIVTGQEPIVPSSSSGEASLGPASLAQYLRCYFKTYLLKSVTDFKREQSSFKLNTYFESETPVSVSSSDLDFASCNQSTPRHSEASLISQAAEPSTMANNIIVREWLQPTEESPAMSGEVEEAYRNMEMRVDASCFGRQHSDRHSICLCLCRI